MNGYWVWCYRKAPWLASGRKMRSSRTLEELPLTVCPGWALNIHFRDFSFKDQILSYESYDLNAKDRYNFII